MGGFIARRERPHRTRPPRASPTQPAARPAGAAGQLVPARRRRHFWWRDL